MSIIIKIDSINPSRSTGLENRLDPGNKKLLGKAHLLKEDVPFDEYLDRQLNDKNFTSHFKKAGQSGAVTASFPAITLNDIIPELHIPFSFLKQI
jgi:hypothetical protein